MSIVSVKVSSKRSRRRWFWRPERCASAAVTVVNWLAAEGAPEKLPAADTTAVSAPAKTVSGSSTVTVSVSVRLPSPS